MIIWILWLSALIASPIIPQNSGDESYSESFTAFADLNDGSYVLVQFLFTNAGMGSDKAGCRILHVPKGKKGNNSSAQFSKSEWQASAKRLKKHHEARSACKAATWDKTTPFTAN